MVTRTEKFTRGMEGQLERLESAVAAGMRRRGWKIGINVPAVQARLGLPHAAVGWVDGRRVLASRSVLEAAPGARLHVEAEVAVVLAGRVPIGASADRARACIRSLRPALEIVDYSKPAADLGEIVSHSMFHEATVLGSESPMAQARDLGTRWPLLSVDGLPADPPRSDLVPSDFGSLVAFVANYLGAFHQRLEAGEILLSGSYATKATPIEAGQEALADFGAMGIVSVAVEG